MNRKLINFFNRVSEGPVDVARSVFEKISKSYFEEVSGNQNFKERCGRISTSEWMQFPR